MNEFDISALSSKRKVQLQAAEAVIAALLDPEVPGGQAIDLAKAYWERYKKEEE